MWTGKYVRSPLVRSLFVNMWYRCCPDLLGESVRPLFVQSHLDSGTKAFLKRSVEKSGWLFTQLYHSFVSTVLSPVVSRTSINGSVVVPSCHVFSVSGFWRDSWTSEPGMEVWTEPRPENIHLPLCLCRAVMLRVLGIDEWQQTGFHYDVISCLNLLDRCNDPLHLLRDIKKSLVPNTGRLILAAVLPFQPYVEVGGQWQRPKEHLKIKGKTWEEQVTNLSNEVFRRVGFEVEAVTRLPYLCEGDMYNDYYVLDDAVFVLKASEDKGPV
uniref:Methyltransferase 9, His-X-His N1-histidine n=1 Tax=Lates calcarifer TaxID=8187 RepID=A0A4W6EVA9_LATCA